MELLKRIDEDLKNAMRNKDKFRLNVLRSLKSAIKYEIIEAGDQLNDEEIFVVLKKQIKSRLQAIEMYEKGGRSELAENEQAEVTIISEYMPTPLTEAETVDLVEATISELQAQSMKDMGSVMGSLKSRFGSRIDGKILSQIVRDKLSQ
jgi:uncharacterized protein YqeY